MKDLNEANRRMFVEGCARMLRRPPKTAAAITYNSVEAMRVVMASALKDYPSQWHLEPGEALHGFGKADTGTTGGSGAGVKP